MKEYTEFKNNKPFVRVTNRTYSKDSGSGRRSYSLVREASRTEYINGNVATTYDYTRDNKGNRVSKVVKDYQSGIKKVKTYEAKKEAQQKAATAIVTGKTSIFQQEASVA